MERLFIRVLQMSLAGAVVILGVLLLRLLMRRSPGRFRYLLWIVPAFRLCVPLSLTSPVSLFRLLRSGTLGGGDYTPAGLTLPLENAITAASTGAALSPAAAAQTAADPAFSWLRVLAWVWLAVAAALLLYSLASSLLLRRRLATAVRLQGRVYQASGIDTPFLLGLFRPRIYIPWGMEGADLEYALTHEHCHIRRGDSWWRLLGWLILCVHWYNPLCWLGYFFMGRDMEQSCDEAVLEHLGDVRREYSESLLHIAGKSRLSSPAPLAFGESGVGSRVRNVLRRKKARKWVKVTTLLLCILFTAAWITDPVTAELLAPELTVNGDGTLGALQWGMTPEEILAADSRFEAREEGKYQDIVLVMEGASVLGHTGTVRLRFAPTIIDEELHRSRRGIPLLHLITVLYPGEISLREDLTELFGEPVKHALDYYSDP
jgi:beta-lactamase regulating signal transducer with metallopeptidase domain